MSAVEHLLYGLEYFLREYRHELPTSYLQEYGLESLDDIETIVRNAVEGSGLNRLVQVRNYLYRSILYMNGLPSYDEYDEERKGEFEYMALELITDLHPRHFAKIASIRLPEESLGLYKLSKETVLPEEVVMHEIAPFVGKTPKGGRMTRKRKNTKRRRRI